MQWLVSECYPEADVIRVVLDNLNTHTPESLKETLDWRFSITDAREKLKRLYPTLSVR